MKDKQNRINDLIKDWAANPRWENITRPYTAEEVVKLQGSVKIEHTLADRGSRLLWSKLKKKSCVTGLGALTGNQAIQEVAAGLEAIYLSGWQVAADANMAGEMYPDQSLYPVNSVPMVVAKINKALLRRDQIQGLEGEEDIKLTPSPKTSMISRL